MAVSPVPPLMHICTSLNAVTLMDKKHTVRYLRETLPPPVRVCTHCLQCTLTLVLHVHVCMYSYFLNVFHVVHVCVHGPVSVQ